VSDPATGVDGGYECHGRLKAVRYEGDDEIIAWLCLRCGVWRDALPSSDLRRAAVEQTMTALLACGAWTRESGFRCT